MRAFSLSSEGVFALAVVLLLTGAPGAAGQSPEEPAEPEESKKGTQVLIIPPAAGHRPSETRTADEFVLPEGIEEEAPRRRTYEPSDLVRGYQSVLTLLSTGHREDALEALYAFETSAMEGREPQEIARLFDAEVEVVRPLGRRDIETLVPILALHHDAYPMYVERGRPFLAGHASRIAASFADLYAREGGSEGSRVLGARALATLGIYAQQRGVKLQAMGLMLHALEYDPDNEAALLGIAAIHERSGNYHRAAEHLLELLEARPQHREGRLRMAVNLRRLEDERQARGLLEELVSEGARDWVASLAYEELGRIHREAGRTERAEEILWEGLERFPENGRLRTQLAFVLDQRRAPQRSLSVIQELTAGEGPYEPSARRLYGMGPQKAYQDALASLAESAATRMPRLARLIDGRVADRPSGMYLTQ